MSTILSIDPGGKGGHTGIVVLDYDAMTPAHIVASWAVPDDVEGFSEWYYSLKFDDRFDTVIVEHFVNRNVPGADLTPVLIEGVVRFLWPEAILSPASGKNTAVSDLVLHGFDMYHFRGDHHHDRREAARHALRWLKKNKHVPTLKKGWS